MTGPVWSFTVAFLKLVPRSTWVALATAAVLTGTHVLSPSLVTGLAVILEIIFVANTAAVAVHELGHMLASRIFGFRFVLLLIGTYGVRRGPEGHLEPYRVSAASFGAGEALGEALHERNLKARLMAVQSAGMIFNMLGIAVSAVHLLSVEDRLTFFGAVCVIFAASNVIVIYRSLKHPKGDFSRIRSVLRKNETGTRILNYHRLSSRLFADSAEQALSEITEEMSQSDLIYLYDRLLDRGDKDRSRRLANLILQKHTEEPIRVRLALASKAAFRNRDSVAAQEYSPDIEEVPSELRWAWLQAAAAMAFNESRFSDCVLLAEQALTDEALTLERQEWFTYAAKSARRRGASASPLNEIAPG